MIKFAQGGDCFRLMRVLTILFVVVLEPGYWSPFRFKPRGVPVRNRDCVSGRQCNGAGTRVPESHHGKPPGGGWHCGITTSEHRIFRVVSCRSRSHPRPLSERPGIVRAAASLLCLSLCRGEGSGTQTVSYLLPHLGLACAAQANLSGCETSPKSRALRAKKLGMAHLDWREACGGRLWCVQEERS
jgi:hypothetical protein